MLQYKPEEYTKEKNRREIKFVKGSKRSIKTIEQKKGVITEWTAEPEEMQEVHKIQAKRESKKGWFTKSGTKRIDNGT